jgi:hypothetical protein
VRHGGLIAATAIALVGLAGCADRPNGLDTYYDETARDAEPAPSIAAAPTSSAVATLTAAPESITPRLADSVTSALLTEADVASEGSLPPNIGCGRELSVRTPGRRVGQSELAIPDGLRAEPAGGRLPGRECQSSGGGTAVRGCRAARSRRAAGRGLPPGLVCRAGLYGPAGEGRPGVDRAGCGGERGARRRGCCPTRSSDRDGTESLSWCPAVECSTALRDADVRLWGRRNRNDFVIG